jgi:non-ribosomal peptide synthetase component F
MHTDTTYDVPVATPLTAANDTHAGCLHQLFEAAAREWPDAVAIDVPPGRSRPERLLVSYAELERRASAIAARLRWPVTGESVVAIMLPRDSDLLYAAQRRTEGRRGVHVYRSGVPRRTYQLASRR